MADTNAGGEEDFAQQLRDIERLLNDGDKQIQETIDKLPGPVYAVGYDGCYVYVNKVYAQLRGKTTQQLAGSCIFEGKDGETAFAKEREIMDGGELSVTPLDVVVDHSGRRHHFMTYKIPMSTASSDKMLMVVSVDYSSLPVPPAGRDDRQGEKRAAEDSSAGESASEKGGPKDEGEKVVADDAADSPAEPHAAKKVRTD